MEEDYENKYLKYKKKYLDLKTSGGNLGNRLSGLFKKSDIDIHKERTRKLLMARLKLSEDYLKSLVRGLDEKTKNSVLRFYKENFDTGLLKDGKVFQEINKINNITDSIENILNGMFNTRDLNNIIKELVNKGIDVVYNEVYNKNITLNNLSNSDYPKKTPNLKNLEELIKTVGYIDMCKKLGIKLDMEVCTLENITNKKQRIEKSNLMVKKISDILVDLNKDITKAKNDINGAIMNASKAIENRDKILKDYSTKADLSMPADNFENLEEILKRELLYKKLTDANISSELKVNLSDLSGDIEKDKLFLLNKLKEIFISQKDISDDKTIKLFL